jgi:hypothetical protein
MKLILLNGPPGCGKDTIGEFFGGIRRVHITKFAKKVKDMAHRMMGINNVPHDYYEAVKNTPLEELHGITPRQLYIAISENLCKPLFGKTFFGERLVDEIMVRKVQHPEMDFVVITDCGFKDEVRALALKFGEENIFMFQIFRPGHDYKGDSRGYVRLQGVKTHQIDNGSSLAALRRTAKTAFEKETALKDLAGWI